MILFLDLHAIRFPPFFTSMGIARMNDRADRFINRDRRYSSHVALILAIGPNLAHFLARFAAR
jgi:hypothetical protein